MDNPPPPPLNTYKINYDVTIFAEENKLGIKVVIHDYHSQVIASLVQQLGQAYQAVEVVSLTTCRALEFSSEIGIHSAIVEGDFEVIVKALRKLDNGVYSFGLLINDVVLFSKLSYSHTRRDGNKAAYSLARLAMTTSECTMWMEDVPPRTLPFV